MTPRYQAQGRPEDTAVGHCLLVFSSVSESVAPSTWCSKQSQGNGGAFHWPAPCTWLQKLQCNQCVHGAFNLTFLFFLSQKLPYVYRACNQHKASSLPELPALWLWLHGWWGAESLAHRSQRGSSLCPVSSQFLLHICDATIHTAHTKVKKVEESDWKGAFPCKSIPDTQFLDNWIWMWLGLFLLTHCRINALKLRWFLGLFCGASGGWSSPEHRINE